MKILSHARILFHRLLFIIAAILLAGCLPSDEQRAQVIDDLQQIGRTASGSFHAVKDGVGEGIEQGKAVIEDVGERIDKAQRGMEKIQEGRQLLKEATGIDN